ncbi:MAG: GTPase [Nanoarchaeota archaeon]|nr:50S ribosome-binding GTPase [Nanoarchaeota archaeon]MBU1632096.1 50S ribosome-binding GTPase [Nanoarchaeota archaeon]MBU1875730.1 50S ribosome-binding GTPase [Nanoarchaeota archaeon]
MNFQNIPPVENSKYFLDLAFSKAREKGKSKNLKGNWLQIIRIKESLKLDIIKDTIVPRLEKILHTFPGTADLPQFYIKLIRLTLDYSQLKKSFGAVNWAIKRIRSLQKEYVGNITRTKERDKIKDLSKQFYGRVSSTLKQIDPNLKYLEESRKIMKNYPDIKEMFTVCIYGFPNVGKTTLLNKLTKTKAKTAEYAFTTISINAGYIAKDNIKVQVLDVPGTLARKEKMNIIELQAELVMTDLANLIIYVFDLSGHGGYSIREQEQLLKELNQLGLKDKILIYVSKTDLPEGKPKEDFKHKYHSLEELKEKVIKSATRNN